MAKQDKANSATAGMGEGPSFTIGGRYRVLPESRLPEFDLGSAEAVVALDDRYPDEPVFARICGPISLPRVEMMDNLKHMKDAAVLRPLEWGPVHLGGEARPQLAVVFPRPSSGVLMPEGATTMAPLAVEQITRHILGPTVLTLGYLGQRNMTHRAIRPSNMYWAGRERETIMLGDCVTDAPAVSQPAVFETISSGMTPPIGRGPGLISDDFYALGVSLLLLSTGQCALFGLSDAEVIEAKVARGSYAALMGNGQTPFGLRDVLRGLLADEVRDRWGIEQVEQWLMGGMRRAVQVGSVPTAGRAFEFEGKPYTNCRALAHAFTTNPKAGAKAGADPEFEKWLRRNVLDESVADRVRAIKRSGGDAESSRMLDARQLTRVCSALDSSGPIRYKTLIAKSPALGNVLADAFMRKDKEMIAMVGEVISNGIGYDWYMAQTSELQIRNEKPIQQIRIVQQAMNNAGLGHGIERCLYALSPSFACFSEVVEDHFITDVRELLPALEEIVTRRGKLQKLVDRHLAAFIAARSKLNLDRRFAAMEAARGDVNTIRLGMLNILATIQHRYGPSRLPNLTDWMANEVEPSVSRFHAKSTREEIRKRLAAAAGTGRLPEVNACLNNDKSLRADELAQRKAMRDFAAAGREIAQLESKEFQDSTQETAYRIAAGISGTLAGAMAAFLALT